jgi:hypothetical protein
MTNRNKYLAYWRTRLPEIKEMIASDGKGQVHTLLEENFTQIGNRDSYTFRLDLRNGLVTNNIESSAVARDLYAALREDSETISLLAGREVSLRLDKQFHLHVHSLQLRNQLRIARICWNTNEWVKPSGRFGKSTTPSHEKAYGFGHEEWLFDMDKVIGQYHFGFLEPLRKYPQKYMGRCFDLLLYTMDSATHDKYWIGYLKGVDAITAAEGEEALDIYRTKGWLDRMRDDLMNVGLDGAKIFTDARRRALDVVNVKFSNSALTTLFETPIQVADNDKSISIPRYVLLQHPSTLDFSDEVRGRTGYLFDSGSSGDPDLARTAKKQLMPRQVELELKHNELSTAFFKFLKSKHGTNVRRECKAFGNNRIDIVLRTDEGDIFYEVKTYNFLRTSFRDAIGQLLEYCFYPDVQNATKLFVVSDIEPNQDIQSYVRRLNRVLNIPFGYIQFDYRSNSVVREI